jgi:hypothetical protein
MYLLLHPVLGGLGQRKQVLGIRVTIKRMGPVQAVVKDSQHASVQLKVPELLQSTTCKLTASISRASCD